MDTKKTNSNATLPAIASLNRLRTIFNQKSDKVVETYTLTAKVANKNGQKEIKIADKALATIFQSVDRTIKANDNADKFICTLIYQLEIANAWKAAGYGTLQEMCSALWGFEKATTNTYKNIGKTFFDKDGNEKFAGIAKFSKGALIPLLAIVNDFPSIAGLTMDGEMLQYIIDNALLSPDCTVSEMRNICALFRSGYVPKEWVCEEVQEDGTIIYVLKTTIEGETRLYGFDSCPYMQEGEKPAKTGKKSKKDSKQGESDEEIDVINLANTVGAFFQALDTLQMDDGQRTRYERAKQELLALAQELTVAE